MNKKTILGIAVIALMAIVAVAGCGKKDGTSEGSGSRTVAVKYDPESDFEARAIDGGKGVEITKYVGDKWEVNIPPTIRDIPVTNIGEGAFRNKSLISVTIPNSVTTLEWGAFSNNQLTKVIIPNSVTTIGGRAFEDNQLTWVTIGANVRIPNEYIHFAFKDSGFDEDYTVNYNRAAGTYTRSDTTIQSWRKH